MNILLFTLEYPPYNGGIANYYGSLVKYWPSSSDNIFVLNNNDDRLINKSWPFLKWLPGIWALKKVIKKPKIDYLIIGHVLPLGLIGLIFNKLYGTKYSVILHGLDFSSGVKIWRKRLITKKILNGAEKIICANKYTAELVKNFLGSKTITKIKTVNPGITDRPAVEGDQRLIKKYNLENKKIILSVGRLTKRKGFDKVIEVLPAALKKIPELFYVILGNGEELNNLKIQISNSKLEKNILIINDATDADRDEWYRSCDIFIMPSKNINGDFEGFGIVYLEANLAGKPVIAGNNGGVGEAVIDGMNGLLVDSYNNNNIAEAIFKLASNKSFADKLGAQGRERAIREFDWRKQIKKIYDIIS
jgi:phosphatidyl-myo-inositol dimannoside synthase